MKQALKGNNQSNFNSNLAERVRQKKLVFKPDIDVRGQRTEDAIQNVMNFIDDAVMCEVDTVKILHGKGRDGGMNTQVEEGIMEEEVVLAVKESERQGGM